MDVVRRDSVQRLAAMIMRTFCVRAACARGKAGSHNYVSFSYMDTMFSEHSAGCNAYCASFPNIGAGEVIGALSVQRRGVRNNLVRDACGTQFGQHVLRLICIDSVSIECHRRGGARPTPSRSPSLPM